MEMPLLKKLRQGLDLAGFQTGRRRNGLLVLPVTPHQVGVRLSFYTSDPRWWRITYGEVCFEGSGYYCSPVLFDVRKLTLHLDEFSEEIGLHFGRLLREPGWRWPLFAHWNSYPGYAWSEKAWATYQADRKIRQDWQKRCEERRAGR
jgi:hypothetical protein